MAKSIKNSNIVKLIKNNNIVLSTKNSNIVKSINYDNLMNTTFEFFTYMITDQSDLTELINLFKFFTFALINSFNFSSFIKNEFELNDN